LRIGLLATSSNPVKASCQWKTSFVQGLRSILLFNLKLYLCLKMMKMKGATPMTQIARAR
jgi:hypothetical protein